LRESAEKWVLAARPASLPEAEAVVQRAHGELVYFVATRQETLISLVEIAWMLMPSSARIWNIFAATPACERMPRPTIDTFTMSSS
jgi:hypothetical protein